MHRLLPRVIADQSNEIRPYLSKKTIEYYKPFNNGLAED